MQALLTTLVICTWFLPHHKSVSQNDLSTILISYIQAGTDIADFFSNINEENVKFEPVLVNAIISKGINNLNNLISNNYF